MSSISTTLDVFVTFAIPFKITVSWEKATLYISVVFTYIYISTKYLNLKANILNVAVVHQSINIENRRELLTYLVYFVNRIIMSHSAPAESNFFVN